jgi:aromatic ring-opening dioxygenase catalytic subunit (LigB family)
MEIVTLLPLSQAEIRRKRSGFLNAAFAEELERLTEICGHEFVPTQEMPSVFFGHGNPMNALLRNPYTERWAAIGAELQKPKAILCVSAHWYIQDAAVTISTSPRTIHDFGGFWRELYQVQYPAPGDPDLAARVQQLLKRCQ